MKKTECHCPIRRNIIKQGKKNHICGFAENCHRKDKCSCEFKK
jgi:hypothetical protein